MTCKCFARCEADCVCDHDWTPPELTAARETLAALEAERDQLRAELANLKALLRSICEEWNEGCDPACDSFGHTDTCKGANIAQAKRAMRDEIGRLRAVVGSIERVAACGTAEAFLGISDDGKRLHFAMSVRDAGRLKKAQEEIERLRAELATYQNAPVLATLGPCCGIVRLGDQSEGVVHSAACREDHGGVLGPTIKLIAARKGEGE